ncbi:DUF6351 family protein, partial [Nonomuraea wenchangensis]|uniref:DUF6351 family protein n=2 Tax=Nonomuraea wenchangensis TaxID=568860 RepID=UPI003F4CFEB0
DRAIYTGGVNRLKLADGCVLLGRNVRREELAGAELSYVGADYVTATSDLVAELVRLGHRRILYLREPADTEPTRDREAGYRRGLAAAGIEVDESLIHELADPADLSPAFVGHWTGTAGVTAILVEPSEDNRLTTALDATGSGWYVQGSNTGGVTSPEMLGRGYAVASSSLNVMGNNCNDLLSAETVIVVTGLLNGIIVGQSFPDVASATNFTLMDARLLHFSFNERAPGEFTPEQQRQIAGFRVANSIPNLSGGAVRLDPGGEFASYVPLALRYNAGTHPDGARRDVYDHRERLRQGPGHRLRAPPVGQRGHPVRSFLARRLRVQATDTTGNMIDQTITRAWRVDWCSGLGRCPLLSLRSGPPPAQTVVFTFVPHAASISRGPPAKKRVDSGSVTAQQPTLFW